MNKTEKKTEGCFREIRELINIVLEKDEKGWRFGTEYSAGLDKVFKEFPKDADQIESAVDSLVLRIENIFLKSMGSWEKKNKEKCKNE